jgi:hypothetical protein
MRGRYAPFSHPPITPPRRRARGSNPASAEDVGPRLSPAFARDEPAPDGPSSARSTTSENKLINPHPPSIATPQPRRRPHPTPPTHPLLQDERPSNPSGAARLRVKSVMARHLPPFPLQRRRPSKLRERFQMKLQRERSWNSPKRPCTKSHSPDHQRRNRAVSRSIAPRPTAAPPRRSASVLTLKTHDLTGRQIREATAAATPAVPNPMVPSRHPNRVPRKPRPDSPMCMDAAHF